MFFFFLFFFVVAETYVQGNRCCTGEGVFSAAGESSLFLFFWKRWMDTDAGIAWLERGQAAPPGEIAHVLSVSIRRGSLQTARHFIIFGTKGGQGGRVARPPVRVNRRDVFQRRFSAVLPGCWLTGIRSQSGRGWRRGQPVRHAVRCVRPDAGRAVLFTIWPTYIHTFRGVWVGRANYYSE